MSQPLTPFRARRLRALIDGMWLQLEIETAPDRRLELKRAIRVAELTLTVS